MDNIKRFIYDYFHEPAFGKRLIFMFVGVFLMGFFLSFLIEVDLGTDPCTFMNLTISRALGISFGNWQVILNVFLFVIVILFGRFLIGPGTLANMILIGYIADYFCYLWEKTIPERYFTQFPSRALIFAVALFFFIIAVSFYINANLGVSPYDAIPQIISLRIFPKVPFSSIRIAYDFLVILVGVFFNGKPNVGIVLMALFLGPCISVVGKFMNEKIFRLK